ESSARSARADAEEIFRADDEEAAVRGSGGGIARLAQVVRREHLDLRARLDDAALAAVGEIDAPVGIGDRAGAVRAELKALLVGLRAIRRFPHADHARSLEAEDVLAD